MPKRLAAWLRRIWPQSLLGRLSLVMVAGLLVTQLAASAIWASQLRAKAQVEAQSASLYVAHSASGAIRFFRSLPPNYRLLLIQQLREMGGTRFFVNLNQAYVPVKEIAPHPLARSVIATVGATLKSDLPHSPAIHLAFAWPDQLVVSENDIHLSDLPDSWVQHILLLQPDPAPILVIQTEIEPGNWLYMAALMPNPYFLSSNDPLAWDRLALQGLSLAEIAAVQRQLRPVRRCGGFQRAGGATEAADAGIQFGRQADLVSELRRHVLARHAQPRRQILDAQAAAAGVERGQRPAHQCIGVRAVGCAAFGQAPQQLFFN